MSICAKNVYVYVNFFADIFVVQYLMDFVSEELNHNMKTDILCFILNTCLLVNAFQLLPIELFCNSDSGVPYMPFCLYCFHNFIIVITYWQSWYSQVSVSGHDKIKCPDAIGNHLDDSSMT